MTLGTGVTGPIDQDQWATVEGRLQERDLTARVRERLEMVMGAALDW